MAKDMHGFRLKLAEKIMAHVESEKNLTRLIGRALHTLSDEQVNGHIIVRFIDRVIVDIEEIKLLNQEEALQINLESALAKCRAYRKEITEPLPG